MVKTVGVSSARHLKNVCAYLNDERVIAREGWNLGDPRVGRWEKEMASTREAYGHHVPAKAGAKNTILYHQILAFNADDCKLNGREKGMSGMDCMNYAHEWCEREYPNQEVLLVLHKEHCEDDGTDRWAVHLAVNRTDMESGKRYHAGPGHVAAAHRSKVAREMDKEWGLKETVRGVRNSEIHHRQPSRTVKEMRERQENTVFDFVSKTVFKTLEPKSMRSLVQMKTELAKKGISLAQRKNELYFKNDGYVFKGETIGFNKAEVMDVFKQRELEACKQHERSELSRLKEFVARTIRNLQQERGAEETQLRQEDGKKIGGVKVQQEPQTDDSIGRSGENRPSVERPAPVADTRQVEGRDHQRESKQETIKRYQPKQSERDRQQEQKPHVEIEIAPNLARESRGGSTVMDTTLNKTGIMNKYAAAYAKAKGDKAEPDHINPEETKALYQPATAVGRQREDDDRWREQGSEPPAGIDGMSSIAKDALEGRSDGCETPEEIKALYQQTPSAGKQRNDGERECERGSKPPVGIGGMADDAEAALGVDVPDKDSERNR